MATSTAEVTGTRRPLESSSSSQGSAAVQEGSASPYDLGLMASFEGMATSSASAARETIESIASDSAAYSGSSGSGRSVTTPATPASASISSHPSEAHSRPRSPTDGGALPGPASFPMQNGRQSSANADDGAAMGATNASHAPRFNQSSGEVVHHGHLLKRRERGYFKNGFISRYWVLRKVGRRTIACTEHQGYAIRGCTLPLRHLHPFTLPPPVLLTLLLRQQFPHLSQDAMLCEYANRQNWLNGRRARRTVSTVAEGTTIQYVASAQGSSARESVSRGQVRS